MRFLEKVGNALARFFYGRNGVDALCWAGLVLELLLSIAAGFVSGKAAGNILGFFILVLQVVILYRIFSKNLPRRRAENARFLAFFTPKRNAVRAAFERMRDREHKYVHCSCGSYCRVPRGVGTVELRCPKCGKTHRVKT